ncbi:MAG TPA: cell envelope biogenesis protein OmpA [Hyphomicrobiales bacterium]|nr:cell envelope biogenesis protein OmpA [Hyphomicrobiales bacterium]
MKKVIVLAVLATSAVGLAACGPTREDRAVSGGLIGAGAGAAIGAAATGTAGGAIAGAALGGVTGAVIGANTGPYYYENGHRYRRCIGRDEYGRRVYYRC